MYLKLSIRNARRSIVDYLLYITAMITLVSIMEVSNCIAFAGKIQTGFQTASLPALITIIMVILVGYIDTFMLKQRSKEFANYILLGMEKNKLSYMFICEILIIGVMCFGIGAAIGAGIYIVLGETVWLKETEMSIKVLSYSLFQTFFYFCLTEAVCTFRIRRDIGKLQIRELMCEKVRNQNLSDNNKNRGFKAAFIINLVCLIGLICAITFLPGYTAFSVISIISIPLLGAVFLFYKCFFDYLYEARQKQSDFLFFKNRLYMAAQITSGSKTNAIMNGIFCMCMLFSASSFCFGVIMLKPYIRLFDKGSQQYMGFLQISICIIFIVIYFSILTLQQVVELRNEAKSIQVMHFIGKSEKQLRDIIKLEITVRLLIPMLMPFCILIFSIPLLNLKLNSLLPAAAHNILIKSACLFGICFVMFYIFYFGAAYKISRQYIKAACCK